MSGSPSNPAPTVSADAVTASAPTLEGVVSDADAAERLVSSRLPLNAALLAWFERAGRPLPARERRDPWFVLVLEIMSQQTQLVRAADAAERFVATFPTPAHLASAPRADVLRAWSGLGYNRRAVALHVAAAALVSRHAGSVPDDIAALETLRGVGPYTARAVAAQAFGRPVGPVDVNVRRVLQRLLGEPRSPARLQALADSLVDRKRPAAWTHATMDLGALVCLPLTPRCPDCPLRRWCATGCGSATDPAPRRVSRHRLADQPRSTAFRATRRWLRGAIVRELAAAPSGTWLRIEGGRGEHDGEAVTAAVQALVRDGLLETLPDGTVRLSTASAG